MIKGVTKKIIEINNPDSIYFEKAVFYLRPNVRELPQEVSRSEAQRYIAKLGLEYNRNRRKSIHVGKNNTFRYYYCFCSCINFYLCSLKYQKNVDFQGNL